MDHILLNCCPPLLTFCPLFAQDDPDELPYMDDQPETTDNPVSGAADQDFSAWGDDPDEGEMQMAPPPTPEQQYGGGCNKRS